MSPSGDTDTLISIENATGSQFDDTLIGDELTNVIQARGGDDTVDGGGGNDILIGGNGSDRFIFGPGDGNDNIVDFAAGAGSDDVIDLRGYTTVSSFEEILLLASDDGAHTTLNFGGDTLFLQNVRSAQLHVEDRLRLYLREVESGHQVRASFVDISRCPDECDHFIQVVDCDPEAFKYVEACLRLIEIELGTPPNYLFTEFDVVAQ